MAQEIFNPSDPKYRCCCGCHVTTGTKIIAYMTFFAFLFSAIAGGFFNPNYIIATIIWFFVGAFICLSPIYGIHKQSPGWLIPYLVVSVIGLIFVAISLASLVVALIPNTTFGERLRLSARQNVPYGYYQQKENENADLTYPIIVLLIQNIISMALGIWYFMIVLRCYQYLVERKNVQQSQAMYSPTAVLVTK